METDPNAVMILNKKNFLNFLRGMETQFGGRGGHGYLGPS